MPFVIDNDRITLTAYLQELLHRCSGGPTDIATAYFNLGAFRLLRESLTGVGAFRLLIGSDPQSGNDLGLRPRSELTGQLANDLSAEPFDEATLRLVEDLIAFLRQPKVQVRHYGQGFMHAKAYLFHQDQVGPGNLADRMRPFAAVVGSSNFTGAGLTANRELNVVHRVFTPDDEATDVEAARKIGYLRSNDRGQRESLLDPSGIDVPDNARRLIKSEVGGRAVADLTAWFERHWAESEDFKEELIELLDASKFGQKEYSPFEVYLKTLYEYFKDELGGDGAGPGRTAVDLAEFQEDAVRKARRILERYDGVLIADSVGLGKTWIGKRLLEDFAYHRRQKAAVVCSASLRRMWDRELSSATIAARIVGMEELGRGGADTSALDDADCVLIDESHNFRNPKSNRYEALALALGRNGGRGKDGEHKKVILLSATPINNDLFDLANQVGLFTNGDPSYFREAGIGDLTRYFREARKRVLANEETPGAALFNLLDEIMVRNTRPYIRAAYPDATINGKRVAFPERRLHTVRYELGDTYGGLYDRIVDEVERLSLAPYRLESYRKKSAIENAEDHAWVEGRETALVGIFKSRFLKRLESSIHAFRESIRRALVFEETYLDYLLNGKVVSSRDFHRLMRYLARDEEDEAGPPSGSVADDLDAHEEAKAYLDSLESVNLNTFDLRRLRHDVDTDIDILRSLYAETEGLVAKDGKLEKLKQLLAGPLRGRKVLVFSSYKDTARYVHRMLTSDGDAKWKKKAGEPHVRRIDSGNHPEERSGILKLFAPAAQDENVPADEQIDVLISTDVLSEGQNLQDCGVIVNYDLTWNPIRLVQRNGRIDRIGSPHTETGIDIFNMFPEDELESLLKLIERLSGRIETIDSFGLLDSSILGEAVHPRTFNVLRRIEEGDISVLDEEEARAELAGPEVLLKDLKAMLARGGGAEVETLPDGIHSGLRRNANGMFFYFQAPRANGEGVRHLWRYIDAATGEISQNRYEIAGLIACHADEPRYIGDQDVFALQERVIEHLLAEDRQAEAREAAPAAAAKTQHNVDGALKDILRRRTADRDRAKAAIKFVAEPMGGPLQKRLKAIFDDWRQTGADATFVEAVASLAGEFSREGSAAAGYRRLQREDLRLVCFDYVS